MNFCCVFNLALLCAMGSDVVLLCWAVVLCVSIVLCCVVLD